VQIKKLSKTCFQYLCPIVVLQYFKWESTMYYLPNNFVHFQIHLVKTKELRCKQDTSKFSFPVEILFAIPITLSLLLLVLYSNRTMRFTVLYPLVVSLIGILNPLYIILKSKKMTEMLLGNFRDFLQNLQALKNTFKKIRIYPIG